MPKVSQPVSNVWPQACLTFVLDRQVSTEEWRSNLSDWLLRLEPQAGLLSGDLPAVFHHQSDGKPATGTPLFRFHCTANTGRVYALGADAVHTVERVAAAISRSKAVRPWRNAPMVLTQDLSIAPAAQVLSYAVNDLVICRDAEQYKRWSKSAVESRLTHVQDIVKRGLERQIQALGMVFEVPCPVVLNVSHERAIPKLSRQVSAKTFVRVASVVFTLPVDLRGHWVAGGLINRGYGHIVAV